MVRCELHFKFAEYSGLLRWDYLEYSLTLNFKLVMTRLEEEEKLKCWHTFNRV